MDAAGTVAAGGDERRRRDDPGVNDEVSQIVIAANGLEGRAEVVLRRERGRIPAYIQRLSGESQKGEPVDDPEPPTVDDLVAALTERSSRTLGVAAFLAGRCRVAGDAAGRLDAALADLVGSLPVDSLDLLAEGYIEAALSSGLRGDPTATLASLEPLVRGAGDGSHDGMVAAALAQLGDPSGWPILRRDPREGIDHVRLMAAHQLVPFLLYDGQEVDDTAVDVEAELRRLADDPSEWVRGETPDLLEEAGFTLSAAPDARTRHGSPVGVCLQPPPPANP